MGEFLGMGGYGAFVWPSFAITALVMGAMLVVSLRGFRRAEADLARIEQETPEN